MKLAGDAFTKKRKLLTYIKDTIGVIRIAFSNVMTMKKRTSYATRDQVDQAPIAEEGLLDRNRVKLSVKPGQLLLEKNKTNQVISKDLL
jgi:hypothetical protein